ncbi:MAG: glycosyltransferase [Clostridia bacterium]|nr:glycosyltransferase [Clostridia bacterium]
MRVLQVLSSLNRISGVANVVMNYYRMIHDKIEFDFLLYAPVQDSFAEEAESMGARLYYIPKFTALSFGKYKKKVKEFFKAHGGEYDIVHIHELMSQRIIMPIAHRCGIKVVMHSHGPYPDRKMVGLVKSVRNRFLLSGFDKNADYYLACSKHAATAFKARKDVKVLKNGVDVKRYMHGDNMRGELGIDDNTFVVGSVGRITAQKNPLAIIDIFAAVHSLNNNSMLVLAGDGDDESISLIKRRIAENNIQDNVMMLGNCKTVPKLMRGFDAFLMPSLWEGLPVVLVEAQAVGLPCFCSENIPQEADLIGNMVYIDLSDDYKVWAENILNGHRASESQVLDGFIKTGYDLNSNSAELLNIYDEVVSCE